MFELDAGSRTERQKKNQTTAVKQKLYIWVKRTKKALGKISGIFYFCFGLFVHGIDEIGRFFP